MQENTSKVNIENFAFKIRRKRNKNKNKSENAKENPFHLFNIKNLPLFDCYYSLLDFLMNDSKKMKNNYFFYFTLTKNTNEYKIYNVKDWKDFINFNIIYNYLDNRNNLKIEYEIFNLENKNKYDVKIHEPESQKKKLEMMIRDIPSFIFVEKLKEFIFKDDKIISKLIKFLAEEFLQKRYNETELEQKNIDLKKYNINNITQNIEFDLEKIIKNTEKEISLIKEKFNELYDNLKKYHDLENSINDLNKYSELEVDKDIEESILKSKTFNIEDNSFPSFIKILSEKGDFHETLLKETLQNNNDENNNLYMSSVIQSNNELNK